ncbi:hypothetical protein DPMN_007958 [Dreissena polymorpha]|uniref:Uncharacterized protein n=1 Tax=Dreissena polymorpha TaxID=45954 RepID=A0A9D4MX58_DREPO|nr:hypothetical protein DPMN_007958 [Dreissena polymorpha]
MRENILVQDGVRYVGVILTFLRSVPDPLGNLVSTHVELTQWLDVLVQSYHCVYHILYESANEKIL